MSFGFTDLHVAAWHGRRKEVESLLEQKADPLQRNVGTTVTPNGEKIEFNAIGLALLGGHPDLAIYMDARSKPNFQSYSLRHGLSHTQRAYLDSFK
jgi:ankyrin repeat protein